MKGLFAVALVLCLIGLAELAYSLDQDTSEHHTPENDTLSSEHRRYILACGEGSFRPTPGAHCSSAQRCKRGSWINPYVVICTLPTLWNQDTHRCDAKDHVDIQTCTTKHFGCKDGDRRPIPGTPRCTGVQQCVHGTYTTIQHCPNGTRWNLDINKCDTEDTVDIVYAVCHTKPCAVGTVRPRVVGICNIYERCFHGNYSINKCPTGTMLNMDTYSCDTEDHVDTRTCTNKYTVSSGHTPTTPSSHGKHFSVPCGDHRCYYGTCGTYMSCSDSSCQGHVFTYRCNCWTSYGYDGYECQLYKVGKSSCQNNNVRCDHGDCMKNVLNSTYTCLCKNGYTGRDCDLQIAQEYHCNDRCKYGTCVYGRLQYFCNCFDGYTGTHCDMNTAASSTTTTTTTTTPSTTVASTTSTPTTYLRCKVMTLLDLANQVPVTNPNIQSCPSGSSATPEAFVLDHCGVSTPSSWTRGVNVMKECHNIPLYTPVATFMNTAYSTRGGLSGVFLGCLFNGFKLGAQQCDNLPKILHVENGMFTMDSHMYYTVQ